MTGGGAPLRLGPPMQLGFVVPDVDAAANHWARLGAGPFYLMERVDFADCTYLGRPTAFHMSVAVGQWGAVQVELIHQHDDVPTIYTDFGGAKRGGLQHVGVMTEDVQADLARLAAHGIAPVQAGTTANGVRFAYVDTDRIAGAHPGGMIELIEHGPGIDGFFAMVKEKSVGWDGSRPVRRLG
jgi:methylmalonyl-CoA/ethylmalonyl-CoA epimerase